MQPPTLGYRSRNQPDSIGLSGWIVAAILVTVIDLALGLFVVRRVWIDGQYGGIYGFGGYARSMILISSVINAWAFLLVVGVLVTNAARYRWWLCGLFPVQAFIVAMFAPVHFGM